MNLSAKFNATTGLILLVSFLYILHFSHNHSSVSFGYLAWLHKEAAMEENKKVVRRVKVNVFSLEKPPF